MSHEIYQTPALILFSKNMRESNKLLALYTKRFGLIYVSVQSVRELRAKMRQHVHYLSYVDVDLVQGKDMWRLVGIHEQRSALSFVTSPWYPFLDKLAGLMIRLCHGEEAHAALWDDLSWVYGSIGSDYNMDLLELFMVIRILAQLGYWDGDELLVSQDYFSKKQEEYLIQERVRLIEKINQSLLASQL